VGFGGKCGITGVFDEKKWEVGDFSIGGNGGKGESTFFWNRELTLINANRAAGLD
jgi:hypothetical protein